MKRNEEIKIERGAVARAVRKPLEAYYAAIGPGGYDGRSERPGNWEENEELFAAIYKSKYVSRHLDWLYVLQIVYAVIDQHPPLSPDQFAEKFEAAIAATVGQRDYLAIVPVAFKAPFDLPHLRKQALGKSAVIGEFTFSPPAPSVKAINKIIGKHGFPLIEESDFTHAARTSFGAFSDEILVTFNAHGAQDWLRFSVESKSRTLCRLIEVFASLFADTRPSFGETRSVNHFFLLSKTTGGLRRIPTIKPLSFDFELSAALWHSIKRKELNDFFTDVFSSKESMYGRMKNAIKFFSMAFNADDKLTSFLFYVISLESIFSRDKNAPIKATLADLASMLCFPPAQRSSAHDMIRRSYDLRSAIVHAGETSVESKEVQAARLIAARAIYCSLFLCRDLKTGAGKLEDRFFDHLRDRKLGLAKAVVPRAIWSLPEIRLDLDTEEPF